MGVATSNSILVVSFATEKMGEGKDSVQSLPSLESGRFILYLSGLAFAGGL